MLSLRAKAACGAEPLYVCLIPYGWELENELPLLFGVAPEPSVGLIIEFWRYDGLCIIEDGGPPPGCEMMLVLWASDG